MMEYLKAESLKMKHTAVGKLSCLLPTASAVLAFLLTSSFFQVDNYCWWYTALLPGFLPLISILIAQKDKELGNRAILLVSADLSKSWRAKTITGLRLLGISNLCVALYGIAGDILMERAGIQSVIQLSIFECVAGAVILIVTFAWQIPLWMWVTEKAGVLFAIIVGIVVNEIGMIMFSVKEIWFLNPFAIPARLMIPVIHVLPNGLLAREGSETFTWELLSKDVIWQGILICIVLFIVMEFLTEHWFRRQEAR